MIEFFSGSDTYRLREAITACPAALPAETVDLASADGHAQLEALLNRQSLFDVQRSIIAYNALTDARLAQLIQRTGAHERDDILLIAVHAFSSEKRTAAERRNSEALSTLSRSATVLEPLTGAPLQHWVAHRCAVRGTSIVPAASRMLIERIGTDPWALANAIEQLCAYAETTITEDAVSMLVGTRPEHEEWAFSNAIAARQKRDAIVALSQRLAQGTPEQLLVGMLASAIRTLLMVGDLAQRGVSAASIAQRTGLHPFVVSKNMRGAQAYPRAQLVSAHAALARVDRAGKTGTADVVDELFSVVLAL